MAHSKQALKRARQNDELRLKNRAARQTMKTAMKRVEDAVAEKNKEAAVAALAAATQRIDKCGKRNVIHKNTAARKKSALALKVKQLLAT